MQSLVQFLIVITAGFTASGIAANLYKIGGFTTDHLSGNIFRAVVLVFAGPNVIFETAVQARINKTWGPLAFGLVTAAVSYWSLALGLLVLLVARTFGIVMH
jgi:hypothetical protein